MFGDAPRVRVIARLLTVRDVAEPISDFGDVAGLDEDDVRAHLDELKAWGIAEQTDEGWRMPEDSRVARALAEMEWAILQRLAAIADE